MDCRRQRPQSMEAKMAFTSRKIQSFKSLIASKTVYIATMKVSPKKRA